MHSWHALAAPVIYSLPTDAKMSLDALSSKAFYGDCVRVRGFIHSLRYAKKNICTRGLRSKYFAATRMARRWRLKVTDITYRCVGCDDFREHAVAYCSSCEEFSTSYVWTEQDERDEQYARFVRGASPIGFRRAACGGITEDWEQAA